MEIGKERALVISEDRKRKELWEQKEKRKKKKILGA